MAGVCLGDTFHVDLWHPLNFLSLQTHSHVPAAADFTGNMRLGIERAKDCLERVQQRQTTYADQGSRDVNYDVGADLMLNTKKCAIQKSWHSQTNA